MFAQHIRPRNAEFAVWCNGKNLPGNCGAQGGRRHIDKAQAAADSVERLIEKIQQRGAAAGVEVHAPVEGVHVQRCLPGNRRCIDRGSGCGGKITRSIEQASKLEDRIDKGIGGLGGQQRGVARVMLTTLQSRVSASYKFTNPQEKPSWKGKRFRFLIKQPDRIDLWDDYVQQEFRTNAFANAVAFTHAGTGRADADA